MNKKSILLLLLILFGGFGLILSLATLKTPTPIVNLVPLKHPDWPVYSNTPYNFSIQYPSNFTINEHFTYQELGPGQNIPGISFKISKDQYPKTTFGDGYVSVEIRKNVTKCLAKDFLGDQTTTQGTRWIDAIMFSTAIGGGVGAGQIYDETVYARQHEDICYGFRLYIHRSQLANYPAGSVTEFDPKPLQQIFEDMIQSVHFAS